MGDIDMLVTFGYDYAKGEWIPVNARFQEGFPIVHASTKLLTDKGSYLYPEFCELECALFETDGKRWKYALSEGVTFPKVKTLEDSIKECIEILGRY